MCSVFSFVLRVSEHVAMYNKRAGFHRPLHKHVHRIFSRVTYAFVYSHGKDGRDCTDRSEKWFLLQVEPLQDALQVGLSPPLSQTCSRVLRAAEVYRPSIEAAQTQIHPT